MKYQIIAKTVPSQDNREKSELFMSRARFETQSTCWSDMTQRAVSHSNPHKTHSAN